MKKQTKMKYLKIAVPKGYEFYDIRVPDYDWWGTITISFIQKTKKKK